MKLSEISIKCHACCVHFTPDDDRAKRIMSNPLKSQRYISLCRECEEAGFED